MEDISVDRLTATFIKIRDARAKLTSEFKKADAELEEQITTIKRALLDHCEEHNVESVRTAEGMFYRTTKTRYWTSDWESMHRFIAKNKVPEFFEKRLNQTAVKNFLEENPEIVPPGLNTDVSYAVTVRKN